MLVFRAKEPGFHHLSPLGMPLAPDVFLNAPAFGAGKATLDAPGTSWWLPGPGMTGGVRLTAADRLDPADRGQIGQATVNITQIDWIRPDSGTALVIGTLTLPDALELAAVHDPRSAADTPLWRLDIGDALATLLGREGYEFRGSAGTDVFEPAAPILPVYGPVVIHGRGGDDSLSGGRMDDTLRGGTGDDLLTDAGGAGALFGGPGADTLILSPFNDGTRASGGGGDDHVRSSNGSDVLLGKRGADLLEGGRGADRLIGGPGTDRLDAGEGADILRGGPGDDWLRGGAGADVFVFRAGHTGHDIVADFELGSDRLRLSGGGLGEDGSTVVDTVRDGEDLIVTWDDAAESVRLLGLGAWHDDVDALF